MKKATLKDMTGKDENQEYTNLINNDNREQNDEISLMAINELLNKKNLKSISRLKPEQVPIITKLFLFSGVFGTQYTKQLANLMLELNISINGLGRKELVQLVQQRTDIFDMGNMPKKSKDIFR